MGPDDNDHGHGHVGRGERGLVHRIKGAGRPPKLKAENKLVAAVRPWLANVLLNLSTNVIAALGATAEDVEEQLVQQTPRRWVVYEPMALLPTGSFGLGQGDHHGALWPVLLAAVSTADTDMLWRALLAAIPSSGATLTHLAINESIPLQASGAHSGEDSGEIKSQASATEENVLRSPMGLRMLYGDFGPATVCGDGDSDHSDDNGDSRPTAADFDRAFWVWTKQNGIYQTWAPRWTMFSRGNVKEKARLLAWTTDNTGDSNSSSALPNNAWAVDLYAGIGYFVFSYARRGLRVLGWELNPWSAEALRRGAVRNGWTVRVVRSAVELAEPTDIAMVKTSDQIVLFVEDNCHSGRRLAELRVAAAAEAATATVTGETSLSPALCVMHVNCGLLPTSEASWRTAWEMAQSSVGTSCDQTRCCWLHLHVNVGVAELEQRKNAIQGLVDVWAADDGVAATVEHMEFVKTFAPGVWHCVFDVRVVRHAD